MTRCREFWPNQDPLGKRVQLPRGKGFLQIVGIVKTSNYQTLGEPPQPCIYLPLRQNFSDGMILYVRTEQDPSTILASVQGEIHNIDPGLAAEDIRTGSRSSTKRFGVEDRRRTAGRVWTRGPGPCVGWLVRHHGISVNQRRRRSACAWL